MQRHKKECTTEKKKKFKQQSLTKNVVGRIVCKKETTKVLGANKQGC